MDYYKNCPPDKQGPVVEKFSQKMTIQFSNFLRKANLMKNKFGLKIYENFA